MLPPSTDPQVVVVGSGIAGLSAACRLQQLGYSFLVIEASHRPGGAIHSERDRGYLLEWGPNTVRPSAAMDTVLALRPPGGSDPMGSSAIAQKRFIVCKGRLRTPLRTLSCSGFQRILQEPAARKASDQEESIASLVRRRLGQECLDYLVDPFLSGIYAGDPQRLSARHVLRPLARHEKNSGSILRGALTEKLGQALRKKQKSYSGLRSFPAGLSSMAEDLAAPLGDRLELGRTVTSIQKKTDRRFLLDTDSGPVSADQIILTTPAHTTSHLLHPLDPSIASHLDSVPYAPMITVQVGVHREQISHPLDGFGFLCPSRENRKILGALFTSSIFADRAPHEHALLTVFVGGRKHPELLSLSDDQLTVRVLSELDSLIGMRGSPDLFRIQRLPQAIPQYELGHDRVLKTTQNLESRHSGLILAGNWLNGISVGDCMERGLRAADQILQNRPPEQVSGNA